MSDESHRALSRSRAQRRRGRHGHLSIGTDAAYDLGRRGNQPDPVGVVALNARFQAAGQYPDMAQSELTDLVQLMIPFHPIPNLSVSAETLQDWRDKTVSGFCQTGLLPQRLRPLGSPLPR